VRPSQASTAFFQFYEKRLSLERVAALRLATSFSQDRAALFLFK
jgi:hypothetical protein